MSERGRVESLSESPEKKQRRKDNSSFLVHMDPPKSRRRSPASSGKSDNKVKSEASLKREASVVLAENRLLIFRLAAASLIFAFVMISSLSAAYEFIMLILSTAIAGYDLFLKAWGAVRSRSWMDDSLIVCTVTVLAYVIGFEEEGAALMILFQALHLLISLMAEKTANNALSYVDKREEDILILLKEQLQEDGAGNIQMESVMRRSVGTVLAAAIIIAIGYAAAITVFSNYNIRVAIHRAITVILLATPFSMLAAMPVVGKIGLSYAAANGTVFKNALSLEALDGTKTVILEKECFPEPQEAKIASYSSPNLDDRTFFMLISHLVQSSEQAFAAVIKKEAKGETIPGLVSSFSESSGGVEAVINSAPAVFGTRSFAAMRGLSAPESQEKGLVYYYLFLGGRYGGYIAISENNQKDIGDVVHDLRFTGVNKCMLLCSESSEEVSHFAKKSDFDDVFAGVDDENRKEVLDSILDADINKKLYITTEGEKEKSKASIEIRIGTRAGEADAVTFPHYYSNIPILFHISKRMADVAVENAVFAFVIKAILIFLSLIGYCNLWIAVFVDMAAAAATMINSNRVTSNSAIRTFLDK